MSNIETAIAVAAAAHMGQVDKNGEPYILHPIRVMLAQTSSEAQIVGVMHDMIEDTDTTFNDVYSFGFDEQIVHALDAITRRDDEDYFDYVKRAGANEIARPVKVADLRDNLRASVGDADRRARYLKALDMLGETL